jgi:hypothetical protein
VSLRRRASQDDTPIPAINLSNKLNPNNIHFDRELASRYKRMSKAEKEALWAADRAAQQVPPPPIPTFRVSSPVWVSSA